MDRRLADPAPAPLLFEVAAAAAPIAIAIFDAERRCLLTNAAYSALTGRAPAEHRGTKVDELFADAASVTRALAAAADGQSTEFWIALPGASLNEQRHWVGLAFPVPLPDGGCVVATMMRDLTARTHAEREREAALGREQLWRAQAERERDFLRMVLQNGPINIGVTEGPDHRLSLVSDHAVRVVGMPRESILGRPIAETFPEAYAVVRDVYDHVYASGETVTVPERSIRLPDGRELWVYSCYAPVVGADGATTGVMSLSLDVTAMKRTQQIIEAQKGILEMLAAGENLTDVLRRISGVVSAHASAGSLCSILLASDDGRTLRDGSSPDLPDPFTGAIDGVPVQEGAGACGTAAARRSRVITSDIATDPLWQTYREVALGHELRACWSTPILGRAGDLLGTFAIYYRGQREPSAEDIQLVDLLVPTTALAIEGSREQQERRRLLDAEREARRRAEEANRSKDEFVATLSHELRTPLNAILGWTRMLQAGNLDPAAQARALASIERNMRAQSQLVEDLLDMSRIVTGKLRLDVRSVELSGVVDAALDAVRPAAEAKGIRLQKILDPRAAPIAGDSDRLQQVVWNLLSNAIKFTPKGGRVQVRLERVNSHVEIVVSDTGSGIPPDLLPRIFDRFQQGDESRGKAGGLGLGLAIARHLVELHGGTIHVTSDGPALGATFTVKLPVMVAHAERSASEIHPTAGGMDVLAVPPLPLTRILVVEDDEDGREIVTAILMRAGAEVRAAASAAEGRELLASWRPQVLVSDIEMPGEDGYTFISWVRSEPGGSARELPAIALTAFARVEDRIRALAAGFQMHVPKPVEPAELVAVIKALLA